MQSKTIQLQSQTPQPPLIEYHGPTAVTKPRSKRQSRRRRIMSTISTTVTPTSPASSTLLITTEEAAAWCLLMYYHHVPSEVEAKEVLVLDEADKYKCEKCPKRFNTYQALGGHLASHSKNNTSKSLITLIDDDDEDYKGDGDQDEDDDVVFLGSVNRKKVATAGCGGGGGGKERGISGDSDGARRARKKNKKRKFKCPFCPRLFWSGQALGGHKKVHFSCYNLPGRKENPTTRSGRPTIDLNFPPCPVDDDEGVDDVYWS